MGNPFTPSFGRTPPVTAGRQDHLDEFAYALENPGAMARVGLITGARGMGKTVMLNEFERIARNAGWAVISETSLPGLLDRLTSSELPQILDGLAGPGHRRSVSGASVGALGVSASVRSEVENERPVGWDARRYINEITERTGLVITVDEIHRHAADDLRQLTVLVQHSIREERPIVFVAAGLPTSVSDLLHDDVLTFLRRASRFDLDRLPDHAVRRALFEPARDAGLPFSREGAAEAVAGAQGYPFLVQLVGSESFRAAEVDHSSEINERHVRSAIPRARRILTRNVHDTALAALSPKDMEYLRAMAGDDGPSRTGEIAERLGVTAGHAGMYRRRLIDQGLISAPARGVVEFCLPYLRDRLLAEEE